MRNRKSETFVWFQCRLPRLLACFFREILYNLLEMEQVNQKARLPIVIGQWLFFLAVGVLVLGWLLNTPGGLLGKADAIAYSVCHRIEGHSLHLDDRQLPLCARCTGMFLGALLGLLYQSRVGRGRSGMPSWKVGVVLGLLFLAFGVDGVNSYLHFFPGAPGLYEPQNWLRLITGTGMGLGISAVLYPAFNATVWSAVDERPALPGLRSLGALVALAALMDALVLTENPLILYPLALISAGSVVLLLALIYSMVWIMLFRMENRYQRFRQLFYPLVAGFAVALLQIAAIGWLRYLLTHTWGGFPIG